MHLNKNQNLGFTLIELLVVIAIIGVLATLIMSNFNSARERARDVERKSDLDQIKKALRMGYNDNNTYPLAFTIGADYVSTNGQVIYMKSVPHDPSWSVAGDPDYSYAQKELGQGFRLSATLENKSDGDICKSQVRCDGIAVANCVAGTYVVCAD